MFSKQIIPIYAAIAFMAINFTSSAQTKVVVIPLAGDDVPITPTSKTVFVTSVAYNGDLGGISGADDKCQSEADTANPPAPGIFKAWISTDITDSIPSRPSFIKHDLPYNNLDGSNVALNFKDILESKFSGPFKSGGQVYFGVTWTGATDSGQNTSFNCSNWTSSLFLEGAGLGTAGLAGSLNVSPSVGWSDATQFGCDVHWPLYCFEQ